MRQKIGIVLLWIGAAGFSSEAIWAQAPRALIVNAPDGDLTGEDARRLTDLLRGQGYRVTFLEGREASWAQVKRQAQGVHVFVYAGHGSNQGYDGTGGLCLSGPGYTASDPDYDIIPSSDLEASIRLAPGAIVLFQSVCRGAGSSASDGSDIGIEEAVRRVESYSRVFFTMGAAAYCANNYVMGVAAMLERLLAGATLSEAYEAEATMWNEIAYRGTSTYVPAYHLVISTHHKSGTVTIFTWENGRERRRTVPRFREYDLAYAGDPAFRLRPAP
jgi:hypothetical protein